MPALSLRRTALLQTDNDQRVNPIRHPRISRPRLIALLAVATVGLVGGIVATPAPAKVMVSRGVVVVRAGRGGVRVTRSPFRLEFVNTGGRAVLGEVANSQQRPRQQGSIADPIAPGFDNPAAKPLYAPLTFLVGSRSWPSTRAASGAAT